MTHLAVRSHPIRDLDDAVGFVQSLIRLEPRTNVVRERLGLVPMRGLLGRLDNPENALRFVHIAGSKGKGSTALIVEALLEGAGVRTATFTSPHLQRWTERFRVAGEEVPGARLAAAMERLRPQVLALHAEGEDVAPTFFDVLTAAALSLFRESSVDLVILETGLGGRLDATNVVQPAVACITSVELEHTNKLGADLAAVAREKAGIIKPGAALVVGSLPDDAGQEVARRARALAVEPARFGHEFGAERVANGRWAFRDGAFQLEAGLGHRGRVFAHNTSLALACALRSWPSCREWVASSGPDIIGQLVIPGRFQVLGRAPWVIVDGAHTEHSIRALHEALRSLPATRLHVVVSVTRSRNPGRLLAPLLADSVRVFATTADRERSLPASTLAESIKARHPGLEVTTIDNPVEAVLQARRDLPRDDTLCITGSMYMAGAALTALGYECIRPPADC